MGCQALMKQRFEGLGEGRDLSRGLWEQYPASRASWGALGEGEHMGEH